jgi:hypothetical protein
MPSNFRNAVVALERAKRLPSADNIARAVDRCMREYGRGGSMASLRMLEQAEALAKLASDRRAYMPTGTAVWWLLVGAAAAYAVGMWSAVPWVIGPHGVIGGGF